MSSNYDSNHKLGLEVVLKVKSELDIDIDADFLRKCFELQREHQFNHDRTRSLQEMRNLIDEYVSKNDKK